MFWDWKISFWYFLSLDLFFQDEKRSSTSDRNSVYSRDASGDRSEKYRNQDMSEDGMSSPAPPPRPLSSIASGLYSTSWTTSFGVDNFATR